MGVTKIDQFDEEIIITSNIFKALGHPARWAIMQHLLKVNACICQDIVDEIPLAQATISRHLKELKNAELIQGTIEGTSICYCINKKTIQKIKQIIDKINKISNCC